MCSSLARIHIEGGTCSPGGKASLKRPLTSRPTEMATIGRRARCVTEWINLVDNAASSRAATARESHGGGTGALA